MSKIKLLFNFSFQRKLKNERGDTLIEVMLAIAVLGLVVVSCMSIMNRANRGMLDAVERTAVRADINSQTELLNYSRDYRAIVNVWDEIKENNLLDSASAAGGNCSVSDKSFYISRSADDQISIKSGSDVKGENKISRAVPGNGIWIDAVAVTGGATPYIDFYIKACWTRLENDITASSSTIVRLYDPIVQAPGGGIVEEVSKPTNFALNSPTVNGSNLTFTRKDATCAAGTAIDKYQHRVKIDDTYGDWADWGNNSYTIENIGAGHRYTLEGRVRCATTQAPIRYSDWAVDSKYYEYSAPIAAAPSLNSLEWTDNYTATTAEALISSKTTCPAGTTIEYSLTAFRDNDGVIVYSSTSSNPKFSNIYTGYQGYDYMAYATARCVSASSQGPYSNRVDTSYSFYREIAPPGLATNFSTSISGSGSSKIATTTWTAPTCSGGPDVRAEWTSMPSWDDGKTWPQQWYPLPPAYNEPSVATQVASGNIILWQIMYVCTNTVTGSWVYDEIATSPGFKVP